MRHLRGAAVILLLTLNLFFWAGLIIVFAPLRLVSRGRVRRRVIIGLAWFGERWAGVNDRIYAVMLPGTRWDITGLDEPTSKDGRYLIVSNHVSWIDILAIFKIFHNRTSLIRFFLKKELIWMPAVGQAAWALEFPFMRRYTTEYLERHPEKRGADLETTREACRRYREVPVAILNFLEGTRFTASKHDAQSSPYRHLLKPRGGGLSFVLASLGPQLNGMFDVTLAYPDEKVTMWDFVTGRLSRIAVHVRRVDIPPQFFDAAVTEPGPLRDELKQWIDAMWRDKDELIERLTNT